MKRGTRGRKFAAVRQTFVGTYARIETRPHWPHPCATGFRGWWVVDQVVLACSPSAPAPSSLTFGS